MNTIFWFSATGNSLYTAKQLTANLIDAQLIQMTRFKQMDDGIEQMVGFVFPSYYGNLPRVVREFVEELNILPKTYIFAIVTGGGAKTGSIRELRKVLQEKNLNLSYGRGLFMPGNYIIKYNPADPKKTNATLIKADNLIKKFATDITNRVVSVKALPITANNLYKNIETLDLAFKANNNCTGCGLCEKMCPVSNIQIGENSVQSENTKPKWLHHCEHCMACISWCPVKAIDYGKCTQTRRQYRNPRIKVEELIRYKE